jgi:ABC-type ATPase involved in cell division
MQQNKNPIVEFNNVVIDDNSGKIIFKNLSFKIFEKEKIFILGHSDEERTLILFTILGMKKYKSGSVKVIGQDLKHLNKIKLLELRKKIGYVYPQNGLIKNISIKDNISLPLRFNTALTENEINAKIEKLSKIFEINDYLNELYWDLDNTIEKKVLIMRAIINNPKLLLVDEPTTYIEQKDIFMISELFDIILEKKYLSSKTPIIVTSEDFNLAETKADKIFYLKHGEIDVLK